MTREEYSPYKIVHNIKKLREMRKGRQVTPLQIQIIPSNICNLSCVFCAHRMQGHLSSQIFDDKNMMSSEKIIETLDCMQDMKIQAVHYTGGGEPTTHPQFKEILRQTFKRNIEVALVSNGVLLDKEYSELLAAAAWVRISVDAATEDTYKGMKLARQGTFKKVCSNIGTLVAANKKAVIGAGFVVNNKNYKEIFDAAVLCKEMGVHNFRISAAFNPKGFSYFDSFMEEARELSQKAEELSDKNFTVFNLFGGRIKDLFEGENDYSFCPIKELSAYIGADYNVYTCCTLSYNEKGVIGSIKRQNFKQLWNSEEKRTHFKNLIPSRDCRFPCLYKSKNEFINYCLMDRPNHMNFI